MRNRRIVTVIVLALAAGEGQLSEACTFRDTEEKVPFDQAVREEFAQANLVIEAEPKEMIESPNGKLIRFIPLKVWKGEPGNQVVTAAAPPYCACGSVFTLEGTYVLYLGIPRKGGIYPRSMCGGGHSTKSPDSQAERQILDSLANPVKRLWWFLQSKWAT